MDACDPYVTSELEDDGDQGDASYAESGSRMVGHPNEDDEETGDAEPSLGSSGHGEGGAITYLVHAISDGCEMVYDCEGDEHDGTELENEHGDGNPDDEPSLGWTIDGHGLRTELGREDLELATPTVRPQNRTELDGPQIDAETSYRKFLYGLTDEQKKVFRERMTEQRGTICVVFR